MIESIQLAYFINILLRVDKLCQSRQIFQNDEFDELSFVVVHFITYVSMGFTTQGTF